MSVTFQTEFFDDVCDEAEALARAHWEETEASMYGERVYSLNRKQYRAMESANMLHIMTARSDGRMVGYASFFLTYNAHMLGVVASLDGLFVDREFRGHCGLKLLRFAMEQVKACGAKAIQFSSPASRDCGALYRRLGAEVTETVYTKVF